MNNSKHWNFSVLVTLAAVVGAFVAGGAGDAGARIAHDKTWWRQIIANDFTPPEGASLSALVHELSGQLASADPELRDDIAYSILTQWLYVKRLVPPGLRQELIAEWVANLRHGIGGRDTDSVLRRSFSALMLSVAVALDNDTAYLDRREFEALLQSSLDYLRDEQDTRGFDASKGWLHSVAHTADLLKFLGRSRHLAVRQQGMILAAIAAKLERLDHVLVHGEDERLARAVVSIAARPDADHEAFRSFLSGLEQVRGSGLPTPAHLARNQNRKHVAVSLYAVLNTGEREAESLRAARRDVLTLLKTMM
jgi:hypothetical protein